MNKLMRVPTKTLMKTWAPTLKDLGFKVKDSHASRDFGIIQHSVYLNRTQWYPDKIKIRVYISIKDDFLDPPCFEICLMGHVEPDRTRFGEYESKWDEERIPSAISAFLAHGIPWFEKFGKNAEVLSTWLEKATEVGTSVHEMVDPSPPGPPGIEALTKPHLETARRKARRPYDRFLSLLKLSQGDIAAACRYAQAFLKDIPEGVFQGEPERTLRQLKKMGCLHPEDESIFGRALDDD